MTRVVAVHGQSGSGKSTLVRLMEEHLGTDGLAIEENFDEILKTSSYNDHQMGWYRRTTAIYANDNLSCILMEKLTPTSLTVAALISYFITGTVWPIVLLFIGSFGICRLCRWLGSHLYSKIWLYNVFLFHHRQKTNSKQWIWRDRTCIDSYAYCVQNNAISVPSNMPEILLEQTYTTSVAIIMDVSQHIIEKHLRKRLHTQTISRSFAFVTRLLLSSKHMIRRSSAALTTIERWYRKMNVPVIKISELGEKLDHNVTTGDIEWSKRSINILLETIERAIAQRGPSSSTIDESLMPWQIVQNSRLFRFC